MTPEDDRSPEKNPKPIMTRLKAATTPFHSKLESLPYFEALIEHRLPLACYVNQLRALAIVHGVLENEMADIDDTRVQSIWNDAMCKLSLLNEDLAFFKPRVVSDAKASVHSALAMTEKIRLRRIEQPHTLLGYLYVLEGSTLGNFMHRPDVSETFQLDELNGCQYYASYQNQVQTHWDLFSEKMNQVLGGTSVQDSIIEAAHETFEGLESLYAALYPPEESEKTFHVTRINPEAGNHPIPDDEREIEAAIRASDLAWAKFPYYEHRYGERGKRFSDSDTCWLVTLTALDPQAIQKQIEWLCRLLATRGMPTLMMEHTLRFLCDELSNAIPDKAASYEKLHIAAETLKKAREKHMPDETCHSLAGEFEKAVGSEMPAVHKNLCQLLVAAVADEKNGITGTLDSLRDWLTDKERFSDGWIHTVKQTIQRAERMMS